MPVSLILSPEEMGYVGTWNVRTLYAAGQLDILLHQVKDLRWNVIGLSKTRWDGEGEMMKDGHKIIYSGRKDGKHQEGVALVLRKKRYASHDRIQLC